MMGEDLHNKQMKVPFDRRTLTLIFIVCASFACGVYAQLPLPRIPITPKPVGSGARALGQSAFIAVADDATAASWNPAGLINLERPEASFVGAWKSSTKSYSVTDGRVSIDQDSWSESEVNFMSYAQPIEVGNTDVVMSVNYHQVYDLGEGFNYMILTPEYETTIRGSSEGAVSAYSLACGLSMPSHPEVTVGASFNWYAQSLFNDYAWQVNATSSAWNVPRLLSPINVIESTDTFDNFRGYNLTFGLLWDVYLWQGENPLTLGLVYHTPFTAKVDRELIGTYYIPNRDPIPVSYPRKRMEVDFPSSLGSGVNYRISDSLSVAFDVEWKEWSKFKYKYADETPASPIDSDTLAYRLGAERLTFFEGARESVFACRGGVFYEPRPAWDDILPVYGFSAGLGWTVRERFSLDFAYQFRWGEESFPDFDYSIEEHLFVVSLIMYF